MKISYSPLVQSLKSLSDVTRFMAAYFRQLEAIINGNIRFQDNLKCQIVEVHFTTANTLQRIDHNLGQVPNGYTICGCLASGIIYNGRPEPFTDTAIYLKCTAIDTVRILIFV